MTRPTYRSVHPHPPRSPRLTSRAHSKAAPARGRAKRAPTKGSSGGLDALKAAAWALFVKVVRALFKALVKVPFMALISALWSALRATCVALKPWACLAARLLCAGAQVFLYAAYRPLAEVWAFFRYLLRLLATPAGAAATLVGAAAAPFTGPLLRVAGLRRAYYPGEVTPSGQRVATEEGARRLEDKRGGHHKALTDLHELFEAKRGEWGKYAPAQDLHPLVIERLKAEAAIYREVVALLTSSESDLWDIPTRTRRLSQATQALNVTEEWLADALAYTPRSCDVVPCKAHFPCLPPFARGLYDINLPPYLFLENSWAVRYDLAQFFRLRDLSYSLASLRHPTLPLSPEGVALAHAIAGVLIVVACLVTFHIFLRIVAFIGWQGDWSVLYLQSCFPAPGAHPQAIYRRWLKGPQWHHLWHFFGAPWSLRAHMWWRASWPTRGALIAYLILTSLVVTAAFLVLTAGRLVYASFMVTLAGARAARAAAFDTGPLGNKPYPHDMRKM